MTYKPFDNEATRSSVLAAVADARNTAAWNRFFDLYAGFVFSIARSRGLGPEDADDIVQGTFIDLARTLSSFEYKREKGRFRSYLMSLVNWRITDRLRAQRKEAQVIAKGVSGLSGVADFSASSVESFEEQEWQSAAREQALRRLMVEVKNPTHYAAFVASVIEGMDTETVMRLHNLSRDNLYQIRSRLSSRLKEIAAQVNAEMNDGPSGFHQP